MKKIIVILLSLCFLLSVILIAPATGQKEEAEGLSPETIAWLKFAAFGDYTSETFYEALRLKRS